MFFACYVFHAKLSNFQSNATDTFYVNPSRVTQRTFVKGGSLGTETETETERQRDRETERQRET